MPHIRVLVVDDHRIFAESLAAALSAEPDVEVASAVSASGALRALDLAASEGRPLDVLLLDADLGEGPSGQADASDASDARELPRIPSPRTETAPPTPPHGAPVAPALALTARVGGAHPQVRTVMLAERDDPRRAAAALRAGAVGWVAKDSSLSRLLHVVRGVLREETHLPPALLTGVLRELTTQRRHRSESERLLASLTPRELQVLRCMVAGMGRKVVAEKLHLSPHTVRTHMQNVLGKLDVHSTLAAVALARRAGLHPVDGDVPTLP